MTALNVNLGKATVHFKNGSHGTVFNSSLFGIIWRANFFTLPLKVGPFVRSSPILKIFREIYCLLIGRNVWHGWLSFKAIFEKSTCFFRALWKSRPSSGVKVLERGPKRTNVTDSFLKIAMNKRLKINRKDPFNLLIIIRYRQFYKNHKYWKGSISNSWVFHLRYLFIKILNNYKQWPPYWCSELHKMLNFCVVSRFLIVRV